MFNIATWTTTIATTATFFTLNGSTQGGIAGSIIKVTAVASAKYAVEGIVLGSGTLATMFADA